MTEQRYDGVAILSQMSGLAKSDVTGIWEQVKANRTKLDSCKRHRFEARSVKLGEKQTCLECGGTISLMDMGNYIRGYEAAGRSADDIWPGYRKGATA